MSYVSVRVDVEVDLDEIETEDLERELASRRRPASVDDFCDAVTLVGERTDFEAIRALVLAGRHERACERFYVLLRDALGTAI